MQYFCKVIVLYITYFVFKKVELEAHLVPRLFFGTTKRRDFSPLGLYVLVFPSPLRLQKTIFQGCAETKICSGKRGSFFPPPPLRLGGWERYIWQIDLEKVFLPSFYPLALHHFLKECKVAAVVQKKENVLNFYESLLKKEHR